MKNDFWEVPDLLVVGGSNLYGYATEDSDEDKLGFVIPPIESMLGFNGFEQKISSQKEMDEGNDYKIYGIRKFFHNLLRNDTQSLEILFAPEDKIKVCSDIGRSVIKNRHLFISKSMYKRFSGYAYSEFRKVRGVSQVPEKQTVDEKTLIDQMRNTFRPSKKAMDEIINLLYEDKPKKEISSFRKLGKKRKESMEKFGFSVKNAAHCIRLLLEGIELLETGNLTFPRPEIDLNLLKSIRAGEKSLEEVTEKFSELEVKLKEADSKSKLPKSANHKSAEKLLIELISKKCL